jgi:AcrR family transcriptional regulator
MPPPQPTDETRDTVPAEIRAQVMPAVLDELARWGVERFSVEALAERHRLDTAMIYRHWGDRQRLIVDAALADLETWGAATDTGSLRTDLEALARNVTNRINTEEGRTFLRALVMGQRGHHDEETRMMFWRARLAVVRRIIDRARDRGELRDGINTEEGRTFLRALVMGQRGHHDEETRMMFWRARLAVVRRIIDRARDRGELRDGINTVAAIQIVLAPINIRALYSDALVDDDYCAAIADLAWHALARR